MLEIFRVYSIKVELNINYLTLACYGKSHNFQCMNEFVPLKILITKWRRYCNAWKLPV